MLLQVKNLSKYYGKFQALNAISFSISQGEIVGFLGANGAGKSTTMRIISGCLAGSSGTVSLSGENIQTNPIVVKQQIGYLPEIPPLYPQMKVIDYLDFVGTIKNVSNPTATTEEIIKKLNLDDVANKYIDQLSKGYKQRIGLAQALIHNPKLLILDEPTSGLDPAQRSELRSLLLALKNDGHSILLSTHILSEVEAICDRVLIISKGELKASQSLQTLEQHQIQIEIRQSDSDFEAEIKSLQDVSVISFHTPYYLLDVPADQLESVAKIASKYGLRYLAPFNALEDLYLQVTGELK